MLLLQGWDAMRWAGVFDPRSDSRLIGGASVVLAVAIGLGVILGRVRPSRSVQYAVALAIIGVTIPSILALPSPPIDVHVFHEAAGGAILAGQNPYGVDLPNIYSAEASARVYAAEAFEGERLTFSFPYFPIIALAAALGEGAFGDYRLLFAALMAATAVLLAHPRNASLGTVGAVILALAPLGDLAALGWNEPVAVFLLALATDRGATRWGLVVAGFFLSAKQHLFAVLPLSIFLVSPPWNLKHVSRHVGRAFALPVAVLVAFALPHFDRFWFSVVELQLLQPLRPDAKSLLVVLSRQVEGIQGLASVIIPLAFLAGALVLAYRWCDRSPHGFASGVALVILAFLLFTKQTFFNHYFLVVGALLIALAFEPSSERTTAHAPETGSHEGP